MRPLIRKLLPLVGLCWVGMAIAGDVEHKELRCCIPEVNCPTKGGAAGRSGKFMRVSVKAVKDEFTRMVIEIPPTEAQYNRLIDEAFYWEDTSAFDTLDAHIGVIVTCDGEESDILHRHGSVLCNLGKGADFNQIYPECTDPATGTTVILQIEYLSEDELRQEFSELQARKAALDQRAEELEGNIDRRNRELLDHLHGRPGAHNDSGNSSTTESNGYENTPINNSSASWSWRNWLKNLPVTASDKN